MQEKRSQCHKASIISLTELDELPGSGCIGYINRGRTGTIWSCLFWKCAVGDNLTHKGGDGREGEEDQVMSVCFD